MEETEKTSNTSEYLKGIVLNLPEGPGIYQYLNKEGVIIYVGKAKNLKRRVYSYFSKDHQSAKTRMLVSYDYGQMSMQPLYFESDSTFVDTFEKVLAQASIDSKIGLIATGDSFIAGQDKIDAIKGHFPEVLAVEMEGAAIAQAAHSVKKPFIVVRAMSDTAAHDANITFDEFIIQAGKQSAAILVEFLKELA